MYNVRGRDMMGATAHIEDRDGDGIPDAPDRCGCDHDDIG